MSKPAIIIDGISKAYRIGTKEKANRTFREVLVGAAMAPLRRLRQFGSEVGEVVGEDTFWALKDVSFEVQPGEVVGIIGRNGAGKSTLLKILSRITEPTKGEVRLHGRVASLLEVGTGFHPELTGRENIYLNGAILGMKRAEIARKFDEIVAFAEVEKFLDTPVKYYSSGMYVRLAFAVAAHLEPEILIVDEVLAVGDAEFQKKCLGKMQQVSQGEGRTVLFVSHNMVAVRSLCRSCVLKSGQLVLRGASDECVHYYMEGDRQRFETCVEFVRPQGAVQWMTDARLLANGELATRFYMGDEMTLDVGFTAEQPISKPRLGCTLYASDGTCLVNTNNRFQRSECYPVAVREGRITCSFGRIPLVPGRYYVTLWFGDIASDSHVADKAVCFDVVEKDIWGTGRFPPSNVSYMWWPTQFSLGSANVLADRGIAEENLRL